EPAGPELHLLAVDAHPSGAVDDEVDLLLVLRRVVVLPALLPRWQDEVVEPEGADAELAPSLTHHPAGPFTLELAAVDHVVTGHELEYRSYIRRGDRPRSRPLDERSAKRRESRRRPSWRRPAATERRGMAEERE